ncbi:hypothetical protein MMC07_003953 [Pseudocyphellaria aurata]|nr:hypothetical protein [Pseudocyphellaria aurata]
MVENPFHLFSNRAQREDRRPGLYSTHDTQIQVAHYHQESYAAELVAATRIRRWKAKAATQLLLHQLNKIMGDNATRAWWLPLVQMRVNKKTVKEAQRMNACQQDLEHLDLWNLQILGNLVNEGEIDAELLYGLTKSDPVHRAGINSQQGLPKPPTSGIEAGLDSQLGFSDLLGAGRGAQHDATIASSPKTDSKNKRPYEARHLILRTLQQRMGWGTEEYDRSLSLEMGWRKEEGD